MAVAAVLYFDEIGVVVGGVTGTSIILKHLFGIPMWLVNTLINVPLFIYAWKKLDRYSMNKTIFGTIMLSFFLYIMPDDVNFLTGDLLVDVIVGSVIMGAGLGQVFLARGSTGGTDLLATLLNKKYQYLSIPKILAIIDGCIILAGTVVFGIEKGIYAFISIYIITKISESLVDGPNKGKQLYVISEKSSLISDYIMLEVGRGVTLIDVTGAFSGTCRKMIMCVMSTKEMVIIKQKVLEIDSNAVIFVSDVRESFGEGFTK